MDWKIITASFPELWKKYKYAIFILLLGLLLMLIPARSEPEQENTSTTASVESDALSEEQRLARILSQIEGAGDVQVLLSQATGAQTVYQTNDETSTSADSNSVRIETVIVSDSDRGEYGLIQQINPPQYLGAIIVCEGGDRPAVRLAIADAVSKITGLGSDRISILKMK